MTFNIRHFEPDDLEEVLEISILAFTPIHELFRKILGAEIFNRVYPEWKTPQLEYVRSLCDGEDSKNFLAGEENS